MWQNNSPEMPRLNVGYVTQNKNSFDCKGYAISSDIGNDSNDVISFGIPTVTAINNQPS
jgi:hypothetical protein